MKKISKFKVYIFVILLALIVLIAVGVDKNRSENHDILKFKSDRSVLAISKCIHAVSEKFHPKLTRFGLCGGRGTVGGYCANGNTFITPDGQMRIDTKLVDGRSEIWITYPDKLSASAIDAAVQCQ